MKAPLFEFPSYQYEVEDWDFKKKGLLERINNQQMVKDPSDIFITDRSTNGKSYVRYLEGLLKPELFLFYQESKINCSLIDAWAVRYYQGNHQPPHNHMSWGFSGILYVEYDSNVHTPTNFIAPWQDPRTDTTLIRSPKHVKEGTLFIAPSFCLHFVNPNESRKQRTIISFDLKPNPSPHQIVYWSPRRIINN